MTKKFIILALTSGLVSTTAFTINPVTLFRFGAGAVAASLGGALGQVGNKPVPSRPRVQLDSNAPTDMPRSQGGISESGVQIIQSAPQLDGRQNSETPRSSQAELNFSGLSIASTSAFALTSQNQVAFKGTSLALPTEISAALPQSQLVKPMGLGLPSNVEKTYASYLRQVVVNHPYKAAGAVLAVVGVAGVLYYLYKKTNSNRVLKPVVL